MNNDTRRKVPSDDNSTVWEENRTRTMTESSTPPTVSSIDEFLFYRRLKSAIEPNVSQTHLFGESVEELFANASQTFVQEAVTRQDEHGRTLLHHLCLSSGHAVHSWPTRSLALINQFLNADKNQVSVRTQDDYGMTPLHLACGCALATDIVQTLLDSDPAKVTLFMRDRDGRAPLHNACKRRDTPRATIELLLDADVTKKSIIVTNNDQETPFDVATTFVDQPWRFLLIAKHRIDLVKGPNKWRELLRIVLKQFEEDLAAAGVYDQGKENMMRNFVMNFKKQLEYYDMLLNHGIPILELAFWKGEGLPASLEQRQQRWISFDSTEIVQRVAEFL